MTNEVQTKRNKKAFTLVELIIVITILAILATIAFISFQGYSKNARDGNRLATTKNIDTGLQVYKVKTGNFPMPEDYIELLSNGTIIGYQGYFGNDAVNAISMNTLPIDPLDNARFTYTINKAKALYQGVMYLESSENISFLPTTYAENINYTSRFIKTFGNQLGILLSNSGANINKPLQELKSSSFTGIDVQSPTQINAIGEIKVIFNNNRDNDIFSNLSNLGKVTSNYQGIIEYVIVGNCPTGWSENGEVSFMNSGRPVTTSPILKICKYQTNGLSLLTKIVMPTCPIGWNDNGEINFILSGHAHSITPKPHICEKQEGTIISGTQIIMATCPIGWKNNGEVLFDPSGRGYESLSPSIHICEKI